MAPIQLDYASPPLSRPARPLTLVAIGVAAVFAGTVVGATTNAINGAVSPIYFINIMGWWSVPNVWLASVTQGVLEGSVVGLLFSIIVTTAIGIITRGTCTLAFGLLWLGRIILAVYGTWAFGGICGVTWAAASPLSFTNFFGVPGDYVQTLRFAWVGGSIWGAEPGGLLVVIVALIWFGVSWRRMLKEESRDQMATRPSPAIPRQQ
jgi:hypothetical protein